MDAISSFNRKYPTYSRALWITQYEIEFLDKLGMINVPNGANPVEYRLACLKGYVKNIDRRTDWGKMNKEVIKDYATKKLNLLIMRLENKEEPI